MKLDVNRKLLSVWFVDGGFAYLVAHDYRGGKGYRWRGRYCDRDHFGREVKTGWLSRAGSLEYCDIQARNWRGMITWAEYCSEE